MDDDEIERTLRGWGADARETAPSVSAPSVDQLAGGGHRRMLAVLSAAAVVLAVAGATVLFRLVPANHSEAAPAQTSPTSASSPTSSSRNQVAHATQQVTFHELAITVPAGWPLNSQRCGSPQRDTVLLPGDTLGCLAGIPKGITWASFGDQLPFDPLTVAIPRGPAFTRTTVDGAPAEHSIRRDHGDAVIVVDVQSADASVTITSPSLARAQALESTLRVVNVDSSGCSTRFGYRTLHDAPRPSRAGSVGQLVPGSPTRIAICQYGAGQLEQGRTLYRGNAMSFVTTLNGLPTGLSRAPAKDMTCPSGPTAGLLDADVSDQQEYLLIAHYATGPDVHVLVRIGFCGDLGASNGDRTAQRTGSLIRLVTEGGAFSVGWPGHVDPAP